MKHPVCLLLFSAAISMNAGVSYANTPAIAGQPADKPSVTGQDPVSSPPVSESPDRGKLLYENHCTSCHSQYIHNRISDKVNSARDIRQWVIRWARNLDLDWQNDDIELVTDYLNKHFYHFQQ